VQNSISIQLSGITFASSTMDGSRLKTVAVTPLSHEYVFAVIVPAKAGFVNNS
jgi:hypothetical protein